MKPFWFSRSEGHVVHKISFTLYGDSLSSHSLEKRKPFSLMRQMLTIHVIDNEMDDIAAYHLVALIYKLVIFKHASEPG